MRAVKNQHIHSYITSTHTSITLLKKNEIWYLGGFRNKNSDPASRNHHRYCIFPFFHAQNAQRFLSCGLKFCFFPRFPCRPVTGGHISPPSRRLACSQGLGLRHSSRKWWNWERLRLSFSHQPNRIRIWSETLHVIIKYKEIMFLV